MGEKMISSWQRWKKVLSPLLRAGDLAGISEETMATFVRSLGDFLRKHVNPKSPEQRMMKELWEIASPEEKRVLAELLIRSIKKL